MNIANRQRALAVVIALHGLVFCLGDSASAQPQATELPPREQDEYDRIQKRLRDYRGYLTSADWTLGHCADPKELKSVSKTLALRWAFEDTKQIPKLVEAGGVKGGKIRFAKLLENKDPVVRGYGAVLLAVIGDTAYKKSIARLLEDKPAPPTIEEHGFPSDEDRDKAAIALMFRNYDRGQAAIALGLMGAKEYAPRLSELLSSPDLSDRAGAASGLGGMGAKEYIEDIAELLVDREDRVQIAATGALAVLGAKEYAKDIAGLLTDGGDPAVCETACYALARLGAKEQAKELAALLKEEFQKGDAAKALALLGAREYIKEIAQLTESDRPLLRCDAMIALSILDAKQYADQVAAHLDDEEAFVRAYAATALLIMGDQTRSKGIVAVVRSEWKELETDSYHPRPAPYFAARIELHPLVAERWRQLKTRAVEGWERLNRSDSGLQGGAPEDAEMPADFLKVESKAWSRWLDEDLHVFWHGIPLRDVLASAFGAAAFTVDEVKALGTPITFDASNMTRRASLWRLSRRYGFTIQWAQKDEPRIFMGLSEAEHREHQVGGVTLTAITQVMRSDYKTYQDLKRRGRVTKEEIMDGILYYAIDVDRDLNFGDSAAHVNEVQRYKTKVPGKRSWNRGHKSPQG